MPNRVANGNIKPSRFVKIDTTTNYKILQASTNDPIIGISQEGTNFPPLSDLVTTNYAATAGQQTRVYEQGEECHVLAGASITAGQRLKSDSDGAAVPVLTTGTVIQECGAIAEEGASSGEMVRVTVNLARILPAAS